MLLLEEAGYRSVNDLVGEDVDRLAIRSGLGIKKSRQVQAGATQFLAKELASIESARARLIAEGRVPTAAAIDEAAGGEPKATETNRQ